MAKEAVQEYLTGESDDVDVLDSATLTWKKTRWLADKDTEHFVVFYLKNNYRIIKHETVAQGGLDGTIVDARVVLKDALLCGATCMICVHNHPSGSTRPSRQDDGLTTKIKNASDLLGIKLVDHVIVTDKNYYSYHENGKL